MAVDTANAQTDYDIYKEQNRIAKKTKYTNNIYTKYFSASDFVIKVVGTTGSSIWLDRASGLAVTESLGSAHIYTVGDSRAKFFMRGNLAVSGFISINFTSPTYLPRAVTKATSVSTSFKKLTIREVAKLNASELAQYKIDMSTYENTSIDPMSTLELSDLPLFNIELEYNNTDPTNIVTSITKTIYNVQLTGYEQGVDIGSDGQLVDGYRFIAKEMR